MRFETEPVLMQKPWGVLRNRCISIHLLLRGCPINVFGRVLLVPEPGTVEEKREEGFEVFKISASYPVRFQTEPTWPGSETVFKVF